MTFWQIGVNARLARDRSRMASREYGRAAKWSTMKASNSLERRDKGFQHDGR